MAHLPGRLAGATLALAMGLLASPIEARPMPTGGLADRWLLNATEVRSLPPGWGEGLHALSALAGPGRPATLVPGARWLTPPGGTPLPWARLRAAGFRLVPTGLSTRQELVAWLGLGVDGAGSDRPDVLAAALASADADGDGRAGELLAPDGLPDSERFELRGYAGARGLRPENTLPAFEAALQTGVGAIEVPVRVTRDGIAVPALEATVRPGKHRVLGRSLAPALTTGLAPQGPALAALTMEELRARFDRGVAMVGQPAQTLAPESSPFAAAYSRERGWPSLHAYVSLQEAFTFARALAQDATSGPGRLLPDAAARARVAGRVRWVVALPQGAEGIPAGRAALAAARGAQVMDRLTLQASEPATLAALHHEAPGVALALALP